MDRESILREIIRVILQIAGKEAAPSDRFMDDLELSSLELMDIAGEIEDGFDIELDTGKLRTLSTIDELADYVWEVVESARGTYAICIEGGERVSYEGRLRTFILAHVSEIEKDDTIDFIHEVERWEETAETGDEKVFNNMLIRKK